MTAVGALWVDGTFWFESGEGTRKGRKPRPRAALHLSVATHDFDLVVEGLAEKVTDPSTVAALADRWAADGWPARVDDSGTALTAEFSAPSAGPPPWQRRRMSRNCTSTNRSAMRCSQPWTAGWRMRSPRSRG